MDRNLGKHDQMTSRERILAALECKPVDRIPFVPLIDVYTLLDMPANIQNSLQTSTDTYWQGMLEASRAIGCDIMLRHVDVTRTLSLQAPHLHGFGYFIPPVRVSSQMAGSVLIETLETPVGTLNGTWGSTEYHGWIPHPIRHLVSNFEELEIFHYAVDHLSAEPPPPDFENFLQAEKAVGPEGIATTSFLNTPFMHLIETIWGLENTYYLLHDYPQEVEAILEKLHQAQKLIVERIADSPAKVVIQYENTSSTLLSPNVFRKYCLPHINEYAEILKSAGKIYLVHMCGKLRSFADDFVEAKFDGIADISPPPTGDFTLDEAAKQLQGKTVLGGIDANTFINKNMETVEMEVVGLIERIKDYSGVLLGSADTAPRGTPLENFRLIQHLANTVGSYVEGVAATYRAGEYDAFLAREVEGMHPESEEVAPEPPEDEAGLSRAAFALHELTRRLDGKRPDVSATIKFTITDDAVYRLVIEGGKCYLEASDGESDVTLETKTKHLIALFTGKLNPMAAYMTRKIKIDGKYQLLGVLQSARQ